MVFDDSVVALICFIGALALLDVASLRFGVDSRRLTRELPLSSQPVARVTHDIGHHRRVR